MSRRPATTALILTLLMAVVRVPASRAAFHEQLAIDAKAIALANTVTADPPGLMAIHYNPAGLANLPDGGTIGMGLTVPIIKKTSKFTRDPNYGGLLGVDPADDPLIDTEGTSTSGRMYVPIVNDTIDFLVSPNLGIAGRKPGSKWTFAVGQYAPFAVGLVHGEADDPSRFGGKSVYQQFLAYAVPSVSYRFSKKFSMGVAVGMGQTAMGAELDMRSPNDMVALTDALGKATEGLEIPVFSELTLPPPWFGGGIYPYDKVASFELSLRDSFSPFFNVGALYEPFSWLSLGAVYQSGGKAQLHGSYRFDYEQNWQNMVDWLGSSPLLVTTAGMLDLPFNAVPSQSGVATAEMTFPQRAQFGIKLKPFKRLKLMADLHWADWSVVEEDRIEFDQRIQLLRVTKLLGYTGGDSTLVIQRDFEDTWHWSVGAELMLTDWLSFRCGYEHRDSSVQDHLFDLLYALPDLENYGAGFGIHLKNGVQIDLGFGYVVNTSYKVPNNFSTNLNTTDFTKPVYNPYAGLNYEQKTETFMGSMKITMPTKVMGDMLHHSFESLKKVGKALNPFD